MFGPMKDAMRAKTLVSEAQDKDAVQMWIW
jgi:hypothetical protein